MSKNNIYQKASDKLNIDYDIVKDTYNKYWQQIREYIKNIPIDQCYIKDTFDKNQTSFSLYKLGKLYIDYNYLIKRKNDNKESKTSI